jgi:hypothetical protein
MVTVSPNGGRGLDFETWVFRSEICLLETKGFRPTYAGGNMEHPDGFAGPAMGLRGGPAVPTSREKRARCGAPGFGLEGDGAGDRFLVIGNLNAVHWRPFGLMDFFK